MSLHTPRAASVVKGICCATAATTCLAVAIVTPAVLRYVYNAWIAYPKIRARKAEELLASVEEAGEYVGSDRDGCPAPSEEDRMVISSLGILQLLHLMGDDVSDEIMKKSTIISQSVSTSIPQEYLLDELPSGMRRPVSAVYILKCFLGNAIRAHHSTNCLTTIMLQDAIDGAKAADQKRKSRLDSPTSTSSNSDAMDEDSAILGVPVSLKENIMYEGTDSTIGIHSRCFQPTPVSKSTVSPDSSAASPSSPRLNDSSTVKAIRAHGGVFFCKTNVPQTMLSYECHNYVFGTTSNPVNTVYSSGGSSGGEAALIGAGGSVLGVGSDTGGSLRTPAVFCGVAAFRPTSTMFPSRGNVATFPGQEGVIGVAGPLAGNVSDLCYFHRRVLTSPLGIAVSGDGNVHRSRRTHQQPIYNNDDNEEEPNSYRFAYVLDDGLVGVSPANRRAVVETVDALRKAGHTCVELPNGLPHIERAAELFYRIVAADGGSKMRKYISKGEIPIPFLRPLLIGVSLPRVLKPILGWIVARKFDSPFFGKLMQSVGATDISGLYNLIYERNVVRHAIASALYGGAAAGTTPSSFPAVLSCGCGGVGGGGFDALIAPTFPLPGIKHGDSSQASFAIIIQAYFNLLDVPVAAFPTTTVDRHLDGSWDDGGEEDGSKKLTGLGKFVRTLYDADSMHGLPVGVQVAAARGNDDFCLYLAQVVDAAVHQQQQQQRPTGSF